MRRKVLVLLVVLSVMGVVASCTGGRRLDAPPGTGKVVIDADMGELNDDAQAMFLLAAAEGVEVLGVTTVGGNTWPEEGAAYALRQLELIGRTDIPVVTGATNVPAPREDYGGALDRPRPASHRALAVPPHGGYAAVEPAAGSASDFIAEQVKRHPGEVTVFALGPATNLARAVRAHPEMIPLVKEVVYLGDGAESAEFNRWFDPEASRIVFAAPFKRELVVPLEAAERLIMDGKTYERVVAGPQTPVRKLFEELQGPLFANDPEHRVPVWDAVAAAAFLRPEIVSDADGPTVLDVDQDRFWDLYVARIGSNTLCC
ncbi:nucleoside hydrolase [Streptosporangium roseum]|uniref:nucleoside hydrolase n=1 Tax=Streptosporangium roseum TaxID=2001 RepID=UPI0018CC55CB|nr:nucleoside hydrolase [Streptosporangium roseum]